ALLTVDHWDGSPPVTLARHAPILDAISHGRGAEAFGNRFGRHAAAGLFARQAAPLAGVFEDSVVGETWTGETAGPTWPDHRPNGDAVLRAEFEIALVVR